MGRLVWPCLFYTDHPVFAHRPPSTHCALRAIRVKAAPNYRMKMWGKTVNLPFIKMQNQIIIITRGNLSCWQIKVICYMLAQNELHTQNYTEMTLNIMCSLKKKKNWTWFAIISWKSISILKWHTIGSRCKHLIIEIDRLWFFLWFSAVFSRSLSCKTYLLIPDPPKTHYRLPILQISTWSGIRSVRKSILKCAVKVTGVVIANFNLKAFTAIFRIMWRSKDMDTFLMDFKYYL